VSYQDLISWSLRNSSEPAPVFRRLRRWDSISAEFTNISGACRLGYRIETQAAYLALHDLVRSEGETIIDGFARSTRKDTRNTLTFAPNRCSLEGWADFKRRTNSVLAIYLHPNPEDLKDSRLSELPPSLYFESDFLKETMLKIRAALLGTFIDEPCYLESLGCAILYELKHALQYGAQGRGDFRGGLTPRQLSRVEEYVRANISKESSLAELANLVGLSRYHFSRAFKKSTGLAPYQFVIAKRVECAKALLLNRQLSMFEVAAAVGFNNPLQLNRAFRRLVGSAPSAFRQRNGIRS
jgi:AraC family transcriptional regulator